jgi:hypothetical protein
MLRDKSGTPSNSIRQSASVGPCATTTNCRTRSSVTHDNDHGDGTLILVSADHDQSLHILGLVDTAVPGATQNVRNQLPFTGGKWEVSGFPDIPMRMAMVIRRTPTNIASRLDTVRAAIPVPPSRLLRRASALCFHWVLRPDRHLLQDVTRAQQRYRSAGRSARGQRRLQTIDQNY